MLRVSCIFVADGAEIGQKDEDLLEVEPLVCRGEERLELLVYRDPSPLESPGSKKGQNQGVLSLLIYILFNN